MKITIWQHQLLLNEPSVTELLLSLAEFPKTAPLATTEAELLQIGRPSCIPVNSIKARGGIWRPSVDVHAFNTSMTRCDLDLWPPESN